MPLTANNFQNLPSARRSILHAIRSGQEVDLYEGLGRILQHVSDIADSEHRETHAYYCAPQGHVTATGVVKLRDLEQLHDPDYIPIDLPQEAIPLQEAVAEGEEEADENEDDEKVEDDSDDEQEVQEDEGKAVVNTGVAGLAQASELNDAQASEIPSFAGSIATTSSSIEVEYKVSRLPDFRLSHAWLRDGEEIARYNSALVEVKICAKQTSTSPKVPYWDRIERAIDGMAPQVIEAVQVAFADEPYQQEIVAIPTVNAFCRFIYFTRDKLPKLNPAMANEGKGFQDPRGATGQKLYVKYVKHMTQTIQIMYGGGEFFDVNEKKDKKGKKKAALTFGGAFVRHWNNYVDWTQNKDLFPDVDEEVDEE